MDPPSASPLEGVQLGWLIVLLPVSRQLSEWPLVKMSWIKTYFSAAASAKVQSHMQSFTAHFPGFIVQRPPIQFIRVWHYTACSSTK